MKIINFFTIIFIALLFITCKSDNNDPISHIKKLPSKIEYISITNGNKVLDEKEIHNFTYNSNNQLIEYIIIEQYKQSISNEKYSFYYDKYDKIDSIKHFDDDIENTKYEFIHSNDSIKVKEYYSDTIRYTTLILKENKLIEIVRTYNNNKDKAVDKCIYDSNGNLEKYKYYSNNHLFMNYEYKHDIKNGIFLNVENLMAFDQKNNTIETSSFEYDYNGVIKSTNKYFYSTEFDNDNYPIKMIQKSASVDDPTNIVNDGEITITYINAN